MNRGNALVLQNTAESLMAGVDSQREAVALVRSLERAFIPAKSIALGARAYLCEAMLSLAQANVQGADLALASDIADQGMELARLYEAAGYVFLREGMAQLFRANLQVCLVYQPQFLAELVLENLDPRKSEAVLLENAECMNAAQEAVMVGLQVLGARAFTGTDATAKAAAVEHLEELESCERRLDQLRRRS